MAASSSWVRFSIVNEGNPVSWVLVSMVDDATNTLRFSISYDT